jgi:hypothetical protein
MTQENEFMSYKIAYNNINLPILQSLLSKKPFGDFRVAK